MITFAIIQYKDNTYRIQMQDNLLMDHISAEDLPEALQQIRQAVEIAYGKKVTFKAA